MGMWKRTRTTFLSICLGRSSNLLDLPFRFESTKRMTKGGGLREQNRVLQMALGLWRFHKEIDDERGNRYAGEDTKFVLE